MLDGFGFLVAVAFRGWVAAAAITLATGLAFAVMIKAREAVGGYFVLSLGILTAQLSWALFAMVSSAQYSIGGAACLSGIFGTLVLPFASAADLIALGITSHRKPVPRAIWVKLALTKLVFGFVVYCTVVRAAVLCTV